MPDKTFLLLRKDVLPCRQLRSFRDNIIWQLSEAANTATVVVAPTIRQYQVDQGTFGVSDLQALRELGTYVAFLPRDGIARNNAIGVFLMGALPAVGGSAISVILHASVLWAVISLVLGRFKFRMTRSDRMLAWTFTAFAALVLVTALLGKNIEQVPRSTLWLVTFLAPWVMISRLRASPDVNYLLFYLTGAAAGALAACAVAFVQLTFIGTRPEGGAGNPAVFAMISLCLMGLGGLNIASSADKRVMLGIAAVFAGGLAVMLSLTRGVAIAAIPILILLAIFAPAKWRSILSRPAVLVIFAVAILIFFGAQHVLDQRWQQTTDELQLILSNDRSGSVGGRLRLWAAALETIPQSPLWGYGIQNRMAALIPILRLDNNYIYNFSHAHNGFLSVALDGGVFVLSAVIAVLLAPIAIAGNARRDMDFRPRLFATLTISGIYTFCGMTQIMFKHDILDALFVFFAIVVAASIPENTIKQM